VSASGWGCKCALARTVLDPHKLGKKELGFTLKHLEHLNPLLLEVSAASFMSGFLPVLQRQF